MCRAGTAPADLRKRRGARHIPGRAAPRAAPQCAADLRFRAERIVSADREGCRPHGGKAAGGHPLRTVRECPGHHAHVRDPVRPAAAASPGAEPGDVGVLVVPQDPRPAVHLRTEIRLQGPQALGGHEGSAAETEGCQGKAVGQAQGYEGTPGGQAQDGCGRAAGPREGAQGSGEETGPAGPAEGRRPRAGNVRRPGLPAVRLQIVLGGHGRLPGPARGRCLT
jgi:hypothetical protein